MGKRKAWVIQLAAAFRERNFQGTLKGLFWGAAGLLLILAYLPAGFRFSMLNFTYGERGLDPAVRGLFSISLLSCLAGAYLLEAVFRGYFLRRLLKHHEWKRAFWIHLALINVLIFSLIISIGGKVGGIGLVRWWVLENLLQAYWSLLFLFSGSVLSVGLLHGVLIFLRYWLMGDVTGFSETLYFYSAASDDVYWLILACALFAVSLQTVMNEKWGMKEVVRE